MRRRLTILGSTGSIGRQALDVVRRYPDRFEIVGLSAGHDAQYARPARRPSSGPSIWRWNRCEAGPLDGLAAEVLAGPGSAERLSRAPSDVVLNGIVGFAGLAATVGALQAGNRVALANKESLVAGGEWVMDLAASNRIIPVDSEHSAIFQCLEGRRDGGDRGDTVDGVGRARSSPMRRRGSWRLGRRMRSSIPRGGWGRKITIDSATMMNKGLEVIEAHHLFGVALEDVRVVVHRQSVVHGGALFEDGSVVLHAALPDMRLPIAFGLLYPERVDVGAEPVPFDGVSWSFEEPRDDVFRCLPLAVEAGRAGGAYPVALNAANEVAVRGLP